MGCTADRPNPTQPFAATADVANANDIVVTNSVELVAAMVPENSGRRIHVRAGEYNLTQLLTVPDHATLEGEGVMLFDDGGMPTGFDPAGRTTLTMTVNAPGNVITLGNGSTVRGLAIQDLAGRSGNSIGVVSRSAGDHILASISDMEINNPISHALVQSGPVGCAVAVFTQNRNMGADPPPDVGATIEASITHSLIRSSQTGSNCGVFAFNFAPLATVSVALSNNVVGGGLIANGGVSRPDAVHDSRTDIQSHHNIYRNDSPNLCVPQRLGWNTHGGSSTPVALPAPSTERNSLRIQSLDDRIEGFTTGVWMVGGRRFFAAAEATNGNSADLELIGAIINTPSCSGASVDLRIAGAMTGSASLVPGDGNTVHAVIRNVIGSGLRSNVYANVLGPSGPVAPEFQGTGNRLEIDGSLHAFTHTNTGIHPVPAPEFFNGGS
jgi:hypothetical protein